MSQFRLELRCVMLALLGLLPSAQADPAVNALPVEASNFVSSGQVSAETVDSLTRNYIVGEHSVINFDSHDIGANAIVNYLGGEDVRVVGRIGDSKASEIFGQLNSQVNLILLNKHGFLFGSSARVNVNSLTASALDMDADSIDNGVNFIELKDSPDFIPFEDGAEKIYTGTITLQQGAQLVTDQQGSLFFFAPAAIINNAELNAEQGQVTLAAGSEVYLTQPLGETSAILVAVELTAEHVETVHGLNAALASGQQPHAIAAVSNGDGSVDTSGLALEDALTQTIGQIIADRGVVTLLGASVNNKGAISATTSKEIGGKIYLTAATDLESDVTYEMGHDASETKWADISAPSDYPLDLADYAIGTVSISDHSITTTSPDTHDTTTTIEDSNTPQPQGEISVFGQKIHIQDNAQLLAHSGTISLSSKRSDQEDLSQGATGDFLSGDDVYEIVLSDNAKLDVSGLDVTVAMDRNLVAVEFLSNELKDNPILKNNTALREVFLSNKLMVDARQLINVDGTVFEGTALADVSGFIDLIEDDVATRSVFGGDISIEGRNTLSFSSDVLLDVSGGSITYSEGIINPSKLVTAEGQIVALQDASADLDYQGIYTGHDPAEQLVTASYIEGKSAGSIALNMQQVLAPLLADNIHAEVAAGVYQLLNVPSDMAVRSNRPSLYQYAPQGATLTIGNTNINSNIKRQAHLHVGADLNELSLDADTVYLAGNLLEQLGRLEVATSDSIVFAPDLNLQMAPQAALTMVSQAIDLAGSISIPQGVMSIETILPQDNASTATLASVDIDANVDLSGSVLDHTDSLILQRSIDGGSFTLQNDGETRLSTATLIDVSAGAWVELMRNTLALDLGEAGLIDLQLGAGSGADVNVFAFNASSFQGQGIYFDGQVSAGGEFSLALNSNFCIGSEVCSFYAQQTNDDYANRVTTVLPDFFVSNGFNRIALTSSAAEISVNNSLTFAPQANQLSYSLLDGYSNSLSTIPSLLQPPLDLQLSSIYQLALDASATINLNPGSTLGLTSDHSIYMAGDIYSPAGHVTLSQTNGGDRTDFEDTLPFDPSLSIWLDATASINVDAYAASYLHRESTVGEILAAGSIALDADRSYLVLQPGAQLSAQGLAANRQGFDIYGAAYSVTDYAAAGHITLASAERILVDNSVAYFNLAGADNSQLGGTLSVRLDLENRGGDSTETDQFNTHLNRHAQLVVTGTDINTLPTGLSFGEDIEDIATADTSVASSYLSSSQINQSGLGNLQLVVKDHQYKSSLSGQTAAYSLRQGQIVFGDGLDLVINGNLRLDASEFLMPQENAAASVTAHTLLVGSSEVNFNRITPARYQDILESDDTAVFDLRSPTHTTSLSLHADSIGLYGDFVVNDIAQLDIVSANDISLIGLKRNRTASISATADEDDVYFTSSDIIGSLDMQDVDLNLFADVIYPETLTQFTISNSGASSSVDIQQSSSPTSATTPYSLAGDVTISSRDIHLDTLIHVPEGQVTLTGDITTGTEVTLGEQAQVSLSGGAQAIPFGNVLLDRFPLIRLQGSGLESISSQAPLVLDGDNLSDIPEKVFIVDADSIDIQAGSKIDISATDTILQTQFNSGLGGTNDLINNFDGANKFVLAPQASFNFMRSPFDPYNGSAFDVAIAESVVLHEEVFGLAAGTYVKLPPHYALLPGHVLFEQVSGYTQLQAGQSIMLASGQQVLAATMAPNDGLFKQQSHLTLLASDADVIAAGADYTTYNYADVLSIANPDRALAYDAGTAILRANNLNLEGDFSNNHTAGYFGGALDISSENIYIAPTGATAPSNYLMIEDSDLAGLQLESVMLGGSRSVSNNVTSYTIVASNIELADNVSIDLPELILVAEDELSIADNVTLTSSSTANKQASLQLAADGNILLLSGVTDWRYSLDENFAYSATTQLTVGNSFSANFDQSLMLGTSGTINFANTPTITSTAGNLTFIEPSILVDILAASNDRRITDALSADVAQVSLLAADEIVFDHDLILDFANLQVSTPLITLGQNTSAVGIVEINVAGDMTLNGGASTDLVYASSDDNNILSFTVANQTLLQGQHISFDGVSSMTLDTSHLQVDATSVLNIQHDADFSYDTLSMARGEDLQVLVEGDLDISSSASELTTEPTSLFNKLSLHATGAINFDAQLVLNSGILELSSETAAVAIGANTQIDLSGIDLQWRDVDMHTMGGYLRIDALTDITFAQQVSADYFIDVSGYSDQAAGGLELTARQGSVVLGGAGFTAINNNSSAADLFVSSHTQLASDDLATLITLNNNYGFDREFFLNASDQWDIALTADQQLDAERIILASLADVRIAGTLNLVADNPYLGVFAEGQVLLEDSAHISTTVTDAAAGESQIELASWGAGISVASGATMTNTSSASQTDELLLHVMQNDTQDDLLLTNASNNITGFDQITAVGYQQHSMTTLDSSALAIIKSSVDSFASNLSAIESRLSNVAIDATPGVIIASASDLLITGEVDFSAWRFGSEYRAPYVHVYAAGDISIGSSGETGVLTDGVDANGLMQNADSTHFLLSAGRQEISAYPHLVRAASDTGNIDIYAGQEAVAEQLVPVTRTVYVEAWGSYYENAVSYSLLTEGRVSVDDYTGTQQELDDCEASISSGLFNSAGVISSCAGGPSGQPYIPSGVRTGIGDIDVITAGDITFHDKTGSIITVGTDLNTGTLLDGLGANAYAENGGDITLITGGEISGTDHNGLVTEWLWKTNDALIVRNSDGVSTTEAPGWLPVADQFTGDVGSFAGGDITIKSYSNINSVDIALPNTGKQIGDKTLTEQGVSTTTTVGSSIIEVLAGGNLNIDTRGSMVDAKILLADGQATLNVEGDFGQIAGNGALLYLGAGDMDIAARGDINVNRILNPTIFDISEQQLAAECQDCASMTLNNNNYFSYDQAAAVRLAALAGDLQYSNDDDILINQIYDGDSDPIASFTELSVLPPALTLRAFSGDIDFGVDINSQAIQYPSAVGGFKLIANGDVTINSALGQSDIDLGLDSSGQPVVGNNALLPTISNPSNDLALDQITGLDSSVRQLLTLVSMYIVDTNSQSSVTDNQLRHAQTPNRAYIPAGATQDNQNSQILSQTGDLIFAQDPSVGLVTVEALDIKVAGTVSDANIFIQNNNWFDVSTIEANSITSTLALNDQAYIEEAGKSSGITIDGPGRLDIFANTGIDLGVSKGVISRGNLAVSSLDSVPASLNIFVGINDYAQRLDNLLTSYLTDSYTQSLIDTTLTQLNTLANATFGSAITDQQSLSEYTALLASEQLVSAFTGLTATQLQQLDIGGLTSLSAQEKSQLFTSLSAPMQAQVGYQVFNNELFMGATMASFATRIGLGTAGFYAGFERSFNAIRSLYPEHTSALSLLEQEIQTNRIGTDSRDAAVYDALTAISNELMSLPSYLDYVDQQISEYEAAQVDYDPAQLRAEIAQATASGSLLTSDYVITNIQTNISNGVGLQQAINDPLSAAGLNPVMTSEAARVAASAIQVSGSDIVARVQDLQAANDDIFMEDTANLQSPLNLIGGIAGADINIQVPFGYFNAGESLDLDSINLDRSAGELGVISGGGSVQMFLSGDLLVNLQRVVGIGRESLNLFSLYDNIDAGSGAKTTISSRVPSYVFDEEARRTVTYPPSFTGSGIRKLNDDQGDSVSPNLATPYGVLDAGDAGILGDAGLIRSSADVENGSQIDTGSGSGGGETAAPTVAAPSVDSSSSTAASNASESETSQDTAAAEKANSLASDAAAFLNVYVLGVGDGEEQDEDDKRNTLSAL